jgi:hypothetical protein
VILTIATVDPATPSTTAEGPGRSIERGTVVTRDSRTAARATTRAAMVTGMAQ